MKRLMLVIAALAFAVGGAFAQDGSQDGITIRWAEDRGNHSTLDPRVTQSRQEKQFLAQMFETLIAGDSDGSFHPGLAKSWEVSDDGHCWTFYLRDDVTFHDGTPFNAEAVKFTFDSIQDPELGSQGAIDVLGPYEGTEVLDEHTARVCFTGPFAAAKNAFAEIELAIVSPTAVRELGNDGFARNPVGTGPFRFVSWEEGLQITLERNEDYNWAPEFYTTQGPSAVERIVFRFLPDPSTRVAALEAGEVNIAEKIPPLDMLSLEDDPSIETMVGNVAGLTFGVVFNTSKGPLQDIRVRQAFMHAVDRPKIIENMFFGLVDPGFGPISSTTPLYWSGVEEYYNYDPERAAQLLDEAGWVDEDGDGVREKDGEELTLYAPTLVQPEVMVAVQGEVSRVGIDLQVEPVLKARQDELIFANNYDTLVLNWVSNDPSVLIIPFHSRNIPEPGSFGFNWNQIDDPELDALLESGETAASAEERRQIYEEIQRKIMDMALYMGLHNEAQTIGYDASLTGFRFFPGNWQVLFYDVRRAD